MAPDPHLTGPLNSTATDLVRHVIGARFTPGQVLAGRYRVVAPLGKGGMGEVYRADDLTLNQPVALKFLPPLVTTNPERLHQFRKEVAAARRVSHPNVCRVYDIGEHAGQPFLAMEYIDGEDVSSLLRRLGRLPEEKGIEIARQLTSALVAVHDQGLLHRDLKPANVMLDGRGKVRLTDFGLAVAAEDVETESRAGTPMYMAPEQLNGSGVSERSDLFSLGLVLYELFTGQKAFPAETLEELARRHLAGGPARPSSQAGGLHPAAERVILRCLAADPADRPKTAAEVLAALPGGDPLAAALAAGETPSPHLVAAAGGVGRLRRRVAGSLLAATLGTLLLAAGLNDFASLFRRVPQDLDPRALAVQSRKFARQFGYTDPPMDSAHGVVTDRDLLRQLRERDPSAARWRGVESGWPAVIYFWQRQGPDPLTQRQVPSDSTGWAMPGRVAPDEPPLRQPGEVCVFLDLAGRLIEFHAVPPHVQPVEPVGPAPWNRVLEAAGLDSARMMPTEPQRVPPEYADERMAWTGTYSDRPDLPIRVEAAAFHGRLVYFHLGIEGAPDRLSVGVGPGSTIDNLQDLLYRVLGIAGLTVGAWLAWRNRRLGRADVTGAFRLAGGFVVVTLAGWLLTAKHVRDPGGETAILVGMLGRAGWDALALWLAYLALEPVVRKRTPWRLIGWTRLLEGRWHDPRVGRDVLLGLLVGAVGSLLMLLLHLAARGLGWAPDFGELWDVPFTEGAGAVFHLTAFAILIAVRDFFLFFLLALLCRREWLAAVLAIAIQVLPRAIGADPPFVQAVWGLAFYGLAFWLLLRFGFLAYLVCNLARAMFDNLPITLDVSTWYIVPGGAGLVVLMGMAIYGYVVATRGRENSGN